ncbi:mediator of RNA polymerase II transcription subunit 20-like [Tubulanus polymorphus]|uniref:mediator of RNA polymerase II transcription subunit 20-like n=1 Tax=Tubulanus polymorphus TaxID=672921 RepID=UPI003DA4AD0F
MGVVWVLNYPLTEGKSAQQIVDELQKRVEGLGAKKSGLFSVDCETYQSVQTITPQRLSHVMHNSEQPASCFCVLDTGTCLVADTLLDVLMLKLKGFYAPRKSAKVECKGQRYEMDDFIVKIGSVLLGQNQTNKGIMVEVEYTPCFVAADCWHLMKEMTAGFMGGCADNCTNHLRSKLDSLYMQTDTIMQYLEHFNNFRKAAVMIQR